MPAERLQALFVATTDKESSFSIDYQRIADGANSAHNYPPPLWVDFRDGTGSGDRIVDAHRRFEG